jgi:UDP-3-O-[3-hydroxymyristoyl] N-acetylglucosamine deacetylase/3-hydroxyacyl-[acyl-carrier-protein] dehydratase
MEKQKTIKKPVTYSGVGLHTGNKTLVTFKPAEVNTGIIFIRTDLPDKPVITASIDNVVDISRGTTIGRDGNNIHTIEHLMAALCGFRIDNIIIEVDGNDLPVGDGSSLPYIKIIEESGILEQNAPREHFVITKPIKYSSDKAHLVVLPSNELKISCTINYDHPVLRTQYASFDINEETLKNEIAPARTFCFDSEVKQLQAQGLIKGGSIDNAIIVSDKGIYNDLKLRFPDEFVRHKILDLIGDIYLLGRPLKAHIIAICCGHASNIALTRRMKKILDELVIEKKEIIGDRDKFDGIEYGAEGIKELIPHRPPFLFVDRAIISRNELKAIGFKYVDPDEYFLKGHFPGSPIMPGVLIVEAMAQTACVLFMSRSGMKGKLPYFIAIDNVKFRKGVYPGDELRFEIEVLRNRLVGGKVRAKAYVKDNLMVEAEFMFALIDREEAKT